MKMSRQKNPKNSIKDLDQKQQDEEKCPKTKSIIEFDSSVASSIKSLAVNKNDAISSNSNFMQFQLQAIWELFTFQRIVKIFCYICCKKVLIIL